MDARAVNALGARWVVVLTGCWLSIAASLPAQALPPVASALPLRKLDLSRLPAPDRAGGDTAAVLASPEAWPRPDVVMPSAGLSPPVATSSSPVIYDDQVGKPMSAYPAPAPTPDRRVAMPPSGPGLWRDTPPASVRYSPITQASQPKASLPLPEAFQPVAPAPALTMVAPVPARQSVVLAPEVPHGLTSPAASTAFEPAPFIDAPAPAPRTLPMPSVLQAPAVSGPALTMATTASPAWKNAVIPPDSKGEAVGRVPPAPAAVGFTIGAGDTVQIDVLGRPELSAKGNVSGDGRVTVALVGPVNIGGLTPVQAAERIAEAYRQGEYLLSPQVTVTLVDYQSQLLTVLGEVRSPGRFPMRTRLSVLDGLALAGGISDQGASMAYLLRPEGSVVTRYEIDLEALIQSGAGQQYFEMLAGDTLVVPKTQVFYIYGEAKNPNAYKLKPGMTVIQALSLAGGLTDKGSDKRIDIRRRDADGQLRTLTASLNEPLLPDDVVYIRERLF